MKHRMMSQMDRVLLLAAKIQRIYMTGTTTRSQMFHAWLWNIIDTWDNPEEYWNALHNVCPQFWRYEVVSESLTIRRVPRLVKCPDLNIGN